jgi:flagellar motor component MotA
MCGAEEELKAKFYRNMSFRVASMLRESLYTLSYKIEEERQNILNVTVRLAESGEIMFPAVDRFQHKEDELNFFRKHIEQELKSGAQLSLSLCGSVSSEIVQSVRAFLEGKKAALRNIRKLDIGNGLIEAAEVFSSLGTLEELYIFYEIEKLPDWIGKLSSLKILSLNRTNITKLPESISNLVNLTALNVGGTRITELPESIGNLASLTALDVSHTPIKTLPESIGTLRPLNWLNITGSGITKLPKSLQALPDLTILNFRSLGIVELIPDHEMNWDEFIHSYYKSIQTIWRCSEQARHEGLCVLENDIEALAAQGDDFFSFGIRFVIDGIDGASIREILSVTVEQEHDPYKHKLKQILLEGILGIQEGELTIRLITRLDSFVAIPDNEVRIICQEFTACGDWRVFNKLSEIHYDLPEEREEISFIKRVVTLSDKARREGILALESERDLALFAKRDILEYALPLIIDGEEPEYIRFLLDNMIESELDPWKRKLMRAKKTAALSLQNGEPPRIMMPKLLAYFDRHVRALAEPELLKDCQLVPTAL